MFIITHTNGTTFTTIGEGVLDNTLGISLIGQNYHNYGQLIANNFLHLLENQANSVPPTSPVAGQLWWDTSTKILKYFDGSKFKPCSSSAVSDGSPINPLVGDQWWNSTTGQLNIYNGSAWALVGPLYEKGQSFTGMKSSTATDTTSNTHVISTVEVNGNVVGVVNADASFTTVNNINGIIQVGKGITLAPGMTLNGTASNAMTLDGNYANVFVKTTDAVSTLDGSLVIQGLNGLSFDNQNQFSLYTTSNENHISSTDANIVISSGNVSLKLSGADGSVTVSTSPTKSTSIANKGYVDTQIAVTDSTLRSYTHSSISSVVNGSPLPTLKDISTAINNDPYFHINTNALINFKANVNNPTFTGVPRAPTAVVTDNSTQIATTEYVRNVTANITHLGTIDSTGILTSGPIRPTVDNQVDIGTSSLKFRGIYCHTITTDNGDLAEKYTADSKYAPGTVVVFGGNFEVTVSDQYCDHRVAGVVSTNPSYVMNNKVASDLSIALTGKVPCRVVGPVKKGDILVNSQFVGAATALKSPDQWKPGCVIGKSLEDNADTGMKSVAVSVGRF